MRTPLTAFLIVSVLCLGSPAAAQHNAYFLPVERGFLSTAVDLQLSYTRLDLGPGSNLTADVVYLSLEAQAALARRLELGINVPFVTHAVMAYGGSNGGEATHFGDVTANVKLRLAGTQRFAVSLYTNARLPTHSWEGSREYGVLHMGAVGSLSIVGIQAGLGLTSVVVAMDAEEVPAWLGMEAYVGYKVLGLLVPKLALQFLNSVNPDTSADAVALTPGLDLQWRGLRVGAACRVGLGDGGKYFFGGRASLLFHVGWAWDAPPPRFRRSHERDHE